MTGPRADRRRLDVLLVERGLSPSREKAQALILAGAVHVDGVRVDKAAALVPTGAEVACVERSRYVSRGGEKLAHALDRFGIEPRSRTALDAGASTGGFTDVLLQWGAARVYAVDVGYGQLDWKLRTDPRVTVLERTNVRYLQELPERVDMVVADLSFISLTLVLRNLTRLARTDADYVLLVKPQFEAGRGEVGKGGVVRDPETHRAVLLKVATHAQTLGLPVRGLTASPLLGPAGNIEFVAWLGAGVADPPEVRSQIEVALAESSQLARGTD